MPKKERPPVDVLIFAPVKIKVDADDKRFCGDDCPQRCGSGAGFHYGSGNCHSYNLCDLTGERHEMLCYRFEENGYRPYRTLICYGSEVCDERSAKKASKR